MLRTMNITTMRRSPLGACIWRLHRTPRAPPDQRLPAQPSRAPLVCHQNTPLKSASLLVPAHRAGLQGTPHPRSLPQPGQSALHGPDPPFGCCLSYQTYRTPKHAGDQTCAYSVSGFVRRRIRPSTCGAEHRNQASSPLNHGIKLGVLHSLRQLRERRKLSCTSCRVSTPCIQPIRS